MVNERSTGTPSFKQVIIQKKKAQEGFKITGYGERKENRGTSKEKKQKLQKETRSNPKMKEKVSNGKENSNKRADADQRDTTPINIQTEEEGEHEAKKQSRNEKEKETTLNPSSNKATQGACKPKKIETLRMVFTDPEIQAHREHMSEHAIICKFMGLWPMECAFCQWIKQH